MRWRTYYKSIEGAGLFVAKWVGILAALVTVFGAIIKAFQWGNKGHFATILNFFQNQIQIFWLVAVTALLIIVWFWTNGLYQRFVKGFNENFKGNLDDNWDYRGPWRIAEKGTLLVTGSDEGGITKAGTHWENYAFTFEARIINGCLGVIVRAQDLNNYYMFQIKPEKIRPHRRALVPVIIRDETLSENENKQEVQVLQYLIGWQTEHNNTEFKSVTISPRLDDWFNGKVVVKGQSIKIYINDNLIYQRPSLLQIPTGKIGFRNSGTEEAYVRNVKVTLQS